MAPRLVSRRPVCGNGAVDPGMYMRHSAPVSAPTTKSFRREPGATGQNSCQPERVVARIGASFVARLGNRMTIAFTGRLAITNSGSNAHVFHYVSHSKREPRARRQRHTLFEP